MNMMTAIKPQGRLTRAWRIARSRLPLVCRYRRYITSILPFLVIIWAATAAYITLAPRSYTSEFTLILPGSGTGSSLNVESIGQAQTSSSSAFSSPGLSPTENYKQMLTADITLRAAAKIAEEEEEEDFPIPSIKLLDQTNLIEVKLSSRNPAQANKRALALRTAFLKQLDNLRLDEANQREQSDARQLEELSDKVRITQRKLIEFQAEHGLTTLEQFNKRISAVETLNEKERDLRIELSQLSGTAQRLGSSLGTGPRKANLAMRLRGDPIFQRLAQRYAASTADASQKRGTLGPRHSALVQVENEREKLRDALINRGQKITGQSERVIMTQLDTQLATGRSNLFQEMTVNDARVAGLRKALSTVRGDLVNAQKLSPQLIANASELADLQRAQSVAEAVFSSALARLDTNKLDPFASYPLVQTLAEPSLPVQPSSPSTMLALLGAIVASLITLISFGLLWLRQPILNKILQKD